MNLNLHDAIPECIPRQIIKPLQNRTSKLRAALIADSNAAAKKNESSEVDSNSTPFASARSSIVPPKSDVKTPAVTAKPKNIF